MQIKHFHIGYKFYMKFIIKWPAQQKPGFKKNAFYPFSELIMITLFAERNYAYINKVSFSNHFSRVLCHHLLEKQQSFTNHNSPAGVQIGSLALSFDHTLKWELETQGKAAKVRKPAGHSAGNWLNLPPWCGCGPSPKGSCAGTPKGSCQSGWQ